ncbi:MAG: type II secretion system ATPase GspE [Candidatus Marinimicrobia bacterium]|nr:type II secretion system ATPase GspE [Candidatus Neomarinimicrobiota bacterium]
MDFKLFKKGKKREKLSSTLGSKQDVENSIIERIEKFVASENIPQTKLNKLNFTDPSIVESIPEEMARQFNIIPINKKNSKLMVAMANPFDSVAINTIRSKTGFDLDIFYTPYNKIISQIENIYTQKTNFEESMKELVDFEVEEDEEKEREDEEYLRIQAEDAPAIKFVNLLFLQAVQNKASDIHIEPLEKEVKVRLRVDGILKEISPGPKRMQSGIISRIKILGNLDIAERRVPQDGRTQIKIMGRQVDIRISTLPTIYGEKVVMRLLDKESVSLDINDIGFEPKIMKQFKNVLNQAHGMVLVTGPTGSGKTTTLYSSLNYVNSTDKNIVTVEDPVEYRLKGINQVQAKPKVGLNFAAGLRSILRQDPDIVMVGEIRDKETAEIAIKAALTGHLVLSTLHTNDAVATIIRLLNMGIDKYLISSSLSLIIAQRLARRICLHCKTQYSPEPRVIDKLESLKINPDDVSFYKGKGCDYCGGTGYWGRIAVYEFFFMYKEVKELVVQNASEAQIREKGNDLGMESLLENGIKKVNKGLTTIDEILRIV